MSNDKHTPTPWHSSTFEVYDENEQIIADCGYSEDYFTEDGCKANAARIVQCVNACEGLDDPERYFRQMTESGVLALWNDFESLRAEKAELIEALKRFRNYLVDNNDVLPPFPNRSEIDNIEETLAKIETK
jgi:hypothetical protein